MSANPYPPSQPNHYSQGQQYAQPQHYGQGQPQKQPQQHNGQTAPQQHPQQPPQQPHGQISPPPQMHMDQQQAAAADSGGRIETTGRYLGLFTKVKFHSYPSGASGYILDFQADDGAGARGMFICTINKTGEVNAMGEQRISSLLCCLGVQQAQPTLATIMEYDFDRREDVEAQVWLYPEAMNKPIGLVLQREDFTNERTGRDTFRMNLYMAFQASTGRTAKEIIDQIPADGAEQVANVVARLGDIDKRENSAQQGAPQHPAYAGYNQSFGQPPQQQPQQQAQPRQSGFPSVVTPNTPLLPAQGGGFYAPQAGNGAVKPNGAAPAQQPVEFDDDIPF